MATQAKSFHHAGLSFSPTSSSQVSAVPEERGAVAATAHASTFPEPRSPSLSQHGEGQLNRHDKGRQNTDVLYGPQALVSVLGGLLVTALVRHAAQAVAEAPESHRERVLNAGDDRHRDVEDLGSWNERSTRAHMSVLEAERRR